VSDPALERAARPAVKDQVEAILAEYLGRQTAATAVKIAARTWLRVEPEAVTHEQLPRLGHGLEPMLKKLLGGHLASALLERIAREVTR
jgi:ketopantoate hydroxymethyltransferase